MQFRSKLILFSFLFSFLTIFIDPVKQIDNHTYVIGFPINFIWYRNFNGMPDTRFNFFLPNDFVKTEFRIFNFLFCVFIVYVILLILIKTIRKIKKQMLEK